ncbi:uncharacterized protein K452DRAFT_271875 [Aplosporella prunicola CBS 121167]|uniref:Stress-response A/B barrel domain-containing protein n=1 Tax=Aplosporella prunicola CBS 121167 TaxID=1176127 RepID=A0A6A6BCW1_9PEZI|nr:uncharacterized protein K452DRAFT_271875 [Aplosporella prunicola CBS 121167]KAF2141203.1 hypothetical protein K452DRAFT_271875 [Aplosporella prunicola CBS 121167]
MAIVHVVLFQFKQTTTHDQVQDICRRLAALKDTCIHPTTNKPYVKSYGVGKNNSPEGHDGGLSHGLVAEFENEEDRKYYLEKDPSHLAFVASLDGLVQDARVFDFEPGKF